MFPLSFHVRAYYSLLLQLSAEGLIFFAGYRTERYRKVHRGYELEEFLVHHATRFSRACVNLAHSRVHTSCTNLISSCIFVLHARASSLLSLNKFVRCRASSLQKLKPITRCNNIPRFTAEMLSSVSLSVRSCLGTFASENSFFLNLFAYDLEIP